MNSSFQRKHKNVVQNDPVCLCLLKCAMCNVNGITVAVTAIWGGCLASFAVVKGIFSMNIALELQIKLRYVNNILMKTRTMHIKLIKL